MQQRLARGEATALGELYDRFASIVHALAYRVLGDEEAADRVTAEVFGQVWEHPEAYEPKKGSLRSWLAALTRRLAVRSLREHNCVHGSPEEFEERVRAASAAARADYIMVAMPASLRTALEHVHLQHRDYRRTAAQLGVSEDETRRRLRLGLQLLSTAMAGLPTESGTGRPW